MSKNILNVFYYYALDRKCKGKSSLSCLYNRISLIYFYLKKTNYEMRKKLFVDSNDSPRIKTKWKK
jgi:hypothetical protein